MDKIELRNIAYARMTEGQQIAENAGYGGRHDDGGGGAMISEAEAFISGLDGTLPSNWKSFVAEKEREEEQERAEFERLKRKFG